MSRHRAVAVSGPHTTKSSLLAWASVALLTLACSDDRPPSESQSQAPQIVDVAELGGALDRRACTVLDANTPAVRTRNGAIPGATLLTHYRDYELAELPADKARPLVFYCANEYCTASDAAAERARRAGYADVSILRSGIAGWTSAGRPTEPVGR